MAFKGEKKNAMKICCWCVFAGLSSSGALRNKLQFFSDLLKKKIYAA